MRRIEIRVELHPDIGPVVEAGPLEELVRYSKTERLHKVERRMRGCAGPCNIPRVLWNFRLEQENTEFSGCLHYGLPAAGRLG